MAKPARVYWDTCAWLGLLNGEPDKRRALEIIYGNARNGKYEIWTSTLSMIECRHLKSEKLNPRPYEESNDATIKKMFRQPFVKLISMSGDIAENARHIWRTTKEMEKYPDAVHIASALWWNIDVMHTYDKNDLLDLTEKFNCRNDKGSLLQNS